MNQLILDLTSGNTKVVEIPDPVLRSGGIIVKNYSSVISLGTEKMLIEFAKKNLIGKAKDRPDLLKAFLDKAKRDGYLLAFKQAQKRLEKYFPVGYSSSGIVVAVADDVDEFKIGDRVACAGAEYAWHAEKIFVPKNMAAKVPKDVTFNEAAFTTLGSIALNGVRCVEPEIGEVVTVIGLGLIGLLTVQIAKSAGCKVIGIDVDERKIRVAKELGIDLAILRNSQNSQEILEFTNGVGSDSVIITAASSDNDSIELAGKIARNRGKVAIVGSIKLDIPREEFYKKELSVKIPSSYGPGRYDRKYEELGYDYPVGFVRWTISRNMETVLNLMNVGKIKIGEIITKKISLEEAPQIYNEINNSSDLAIGTVIEYKTENRQDSAIKLKDSRPTKNKINCVIIGAGIFTTSTLLPTLHNINDISVNCISTLNGINSRSVADKYKIPNIFSDYKEMIKEKSVDLVFITTRNSSHAQITLDALENNKNVFVEKPLAVTYEQLKEIENKWKDSDKTVMVGFNRRHAPFTREIKRTFKNRTSPMIAHYRINAEKIPKDHWVYDKSEGGGRIISEACHFIDYISYVTNSKIIQVYAASIDKTATEDRLDNFSIIINYEDGSLGTITYTSKGSKKSSKERVEFFSDEKTAVIDNFQSLRIFSNKKDIAKRSYFSQNKGHENEIEYMITNLKNGNRMADEFELSLNSSKATIAALESLKKGMPIQV
ncbi:MAG: bi-domain-containing oxidoreductase [Nitrosarchaeum sp.]|nr:bi-domain-containing oxidoreductase [Nitrosarchaeum sp.]